MFCVLPFFYLIGKLFVYRNNVHLGCDVRGDDDEILQRKEWISASCLCWDDFVLFCCAIKKGTGSVMAFLVSPMASCLNSSFAKSLVSSEWRCHRRFELFKNSENLEIVRGASSIIGGQKNLTLIFFIARVYWAIESVIGRSLQMVPERTRNWQKFQSSQLEGYIPGEIAFAGQPGKSFCDTTKMNRSFRWNERRSSSGPSSREQPPAVVVATLRFTVIFIGFRHVRKERKKQTCCEDRVILGTTDKLRMQ